MTNKIQNKLGRITRSFALAGLVTLASGCGDYSVIEPIFKGKIEGERVLLTRKTYFPNVPKDQRQDTEILELTGSNQTKYILEQQVTGNQRFYPYVMEIHGKITNEYYRDEIPLPIKMNLDYYRNQIEIRLSEDKIKQANMEIERLKQKQAIEKEMLERVKMDLLEKSK